MVIQPDYTILLQMIVFLFVLIILSRFLFKPIMKVMDERWKSSEGLVKDAENLKVTTSSLIKEYEENINKEKAIINDERLRLRIESIDKERDIINRARKEAEEYKIKMYEKISRDSEDVINRLKQDVRNISKSIASKIIGREILSFFILLYYYFQNMKIAFGVSAETHEIHEPFFSSGLLWSFINFTILFGLLIYLLRSPLREFLASRRQSIKETMEKAKKEMESAQKIHKEYTDRLKNIVAEANEIRKIIMEEAEVEREGIINDAKIRAEKIITEARLLAQGEAIKIKQKIQEEIGAMSIKLAEEILNQTLTQEDQERLIKEFISDLNKKEVYH